MDIKIKLEIFKICCELNCLAENLYYSGIDDEKSYLENIEIQIDKLEGLIYD